MHLVSHMAAGAGVTDRAGSRAGPRTRAIKPHVALEIPLGEKPPGRLHARLIQTPPLPRRQVEVRGPHAGGGNADGPDAVRRLQMPRSEEHTSELQSRENL